MDQTKRQSETDWFIKGFHMAIRALCNSLVQRKVLWSWCLSAEPSGNHTVNDCLGPLSITMNRVHKTELQLIPTGDFENIEPGDKKLKKGNATGLQSVHKGQFWFLFEVGFTCYRFNLFSGRKRDGRMPPLRLSTAATGRLEPSGFFVFIACLF